MKHFSFKELEEDLAKEKDGIEYGIHCCVSVIDEQEGLIQSMETAFERNEKQFSCSHSKSTEEETDVQTLSGYVTKVYLECLECGLKKSKYK